MELARNGPFLGCVVNSRGSKTREHLEFEKHGRQIMAARSVFCLLRNVPREHTHT